MLVTNGGQLDLIRGAQAEIRAARSDADFYAAKISRVWARAARTRAYAGIGPFDPHAFQALAPTPRARLKADPWAFVATDWSGTAKYYETTGTTGQVTPTPRTFEDIVWNAVSVAEAWRSVLHEDDRVAILLPSDIVPVADLVVSTSEYLGLPHVRMYPFTTGISDLDRVIGLWPNLRPTVLFLAPGVAGQLTRFLKQRGQLDGMRESVRRILLLGEVSTPALRSRLGDWWGADVYDASYGSTETGTLAATCPQDRMHLLTTANYFELAAPDGTVTPLSEGARGRLVVTPLNLYARPLLRLDTGDEVVVTERCVCGNAAPVIEVGGRSSDVLRVRGVPLTVRAVEEIVYGVTASTGYLLEADTTGDHARLLLERDVDGDRGREGAEIAAVQDAFDAGLGIRWDSVSFVNLLPRTTKAGGSQKSWKRSNIRIVERVS
ncbi:phenylacetate--CoA ligase family protein [Kutzneria sp. CA-103260]|uniref:phenylacetate--CoA ligase family protein n=1 Tax=Kutzneria sp. CA-103260 TaxID=2802641 RepID=UPI001BAD3FA8|nr:AMP-binding protein [Kutzneria sp. CA-103260]QUQ68839.1 AMP-binding enzyme [Kutzneria sp. CA-103260]